MKKKEEIIETFKKYPHIHIEDINDAVHYLLQPTRNPYKIDEERFKAIYSSVAPMSAVVKEYNSTLEKPLKRLPIEPPSWFNDFHGAYVKWKQLIDTYGTSPRQELPSVEELEREINKMYWGSKNGFIEIAQHLVNKYQLPSREWWMDLKEGDKFMYDGEVKIFSELVREEIYLESDGIGHLLSACTPYVEPELTAETVISKHNLSEAEVKAIREGKC